MLNMLVQCWTTALQNERPHEIATMWSKKWANVPAGVREIYSAATADQRAEFVVSFRDYALTWGDWLVIRLSQCGPFQAWAEWQMRSPLSAGPAVGQTAAGVGHMLPMRVFVLPRNALGEMVLPRENYELRDPEFWPHGQSPTKVIRHVPSILRLCWIRNLLNFTVEPLPLVLLILTVVSLAGLAMWGNRSESALEGFLVASVFSSACLLWVVIREFVREFVLVLREGWFRTWKASLVRIAGDPQVPRILDGDSYGLAVMLAAFSGLAQRVLGANPHLRPGSRFSTMMAPFEHNPSEYAATGRLASPFGLRIGGVGNIRPKCLAVNQAGLPQFLVPVSRQAIRKKLREFFRFDHGNRVRLRLRFFVPAAAMKLSGGVRASAPVAAILLCGIFIPALDEWRLMKRLDPPEFDGPARWWPRTGARHDTNLLQLSFKGVSGNPADYFVIVEGSIRGTVAALPSDERTASEITVHGQNDLKRDAARSGAAVVDVSLRAAGGTPDPHRLAVVLFQRRSVAGMKLPPVTVSTFGIPDVQIQEEPQR